MKRYIVQILVVVLVVLGGVMANHGLLGQPAHANSHGLKGAAAGTSNNSDYGGEAAILKAYGDRRSDLMVEASGTVYRILEDDLRGARHQLFILELSSGHTLLISHNIDIAPRIDTLREGDTVRFRGEYEWNERGGVVHWTHHDPDGNDHPDGWLLHNDTYYQ